MRSLFVVLLALAWSPGCLVVDSAPLDRLRAGADTGTADVPLADVPGDAGPPNLAADTCGQPDTELLIGSGTYDVDTTSMNPDFTILGMATGGNDGFFQFDGVSGQFWHFHLAALSPGRNPVLYVVQATGGVCSSSAVAVRNACSMGEGDEHFAFVPPTTGRFFLGIDDGNSGGGRYRLQVIRPTCGNNMQEHGEPCDEGVGGSPVCDNACHILLSDIDGTGRTSVPPGRHNDTTTEAMIVVLPAAPASVLDVGGIIPPTDCYPDVFAVDVGMGERLRVTALNGMAPCMAASEASYTLELQNAAGARIAGGTDPMGCPIVDQVLTNAGRYFVWLNGTGDGTRPVNYTLHFERTP